MNGDKATSVAQGGFSAIKRSRFADHAYGILFHKIVTGELAEDQMLPSEAELCAMFNISRPVVREALERLRAENLITSRRGAGSFVQRRQAPDASTDSVVELQRSALDNLEFRGVIEPQAAMFAALRRTEADLESIQAAVDQYEEVAIRNGGVSEQLDFKFHLAVASAAGNQRFVDAVRIVQHDIDHGVNFVRYVAGFDHLERSRSVHADHSNILAEIRARRPERALATMTAHLEHARIRMMDRDPKTL